MALQVINTGSSLGDRTGDNGRVAFTKVNENFAELYAGAGAYYAELAAETAAAAEFGATLNLAYPYGTSERFSVTGSGIIDDTPGIKAWLKANDGARVGWKPGSHRITDSLPVYSNVIEGRGSREEVQIVPDGNFPVFVNAGHEFIAGAIKQVTVIYNGGVQPTSASGNDQKIGIYWEVVSGRSPNYFNIEDVEVRGAWWAYYDESGSYGCNISRLFGWNCQNLFYKANGTTFTMNQVIGLNCNKGVQLDSCLGFSLHACANDGAVITDGDSVNEFVSCTGIAINGWDSESNTIGGNGGCMFKFTDCTGVFSAHVGHANNFIEDSGYVAMIICDDSPMHFIGHRPEYNSGATELTFTGSGTYYHVLAENGSKVTVSGGEFPQPTVVSGSPTLTPFHATGTARIQVLGASYEGTIGANSFEIVEDYTENTGTLTGCTTSPTGNIRATRGSRQITLHIPQITGESDTTAATITGAIPAGFRPARAQRCPAPITDNGSTAMALAIVGTDGTITLTVNAAASATFTGTGTKGIELCTFTYSLD